MGFLHWNGRTTDLLALHGDRRYSAVWTFSQAWRAATRQWESGLLDDASALFTAARQGMLRHHLELFPEDPNWPEGVTNEQ